MPVNAVRQAAGPRYGRVRSAGDVRAWRAVAELARRGIAAGPALAAVQLAAAESEERLLSGQSFSAGQAMAWLDGQMAVCQ